MNLYKAFVIVRKNYSSSDACGLFNEIARDKALIRSVKAFYEKIQNYKIGGLLISIYAFKTLLTVQLPEDENAAIWAIGEHPNEKRMINLLESCLGYGSVTTFRQKNIYIFNLSNIIFLFSCFLHFRKVRQFVRILHYSRSSGFMPLCFVGSCLAYYTKINYLLNKSITKPKAFLIASHYTPDGAALAAIAKSRNIPYIYIPHANISKSYSLNNLDADLAILTGESVLDAYISQGRKIKSKTIYRGIEGETFPLQLDVLKTFPKRVGIFLTGRTNMDSLNGLIEQLNNTWKVEHILIRPHPVDLVRPDFTALPDHKNVIISKEGTPLNNDIDLVDLAIIGNSSVHLEVLKRGKPVLYYENLDFYGSDPNGFVKYGVVPRIIDISHIDLAEIISFYSDDWIEHFRYFDAGYDVPEHEIKRRTAMETEALINTNQDNLTNMSHK